MRYRNYCLDLTHRLQASLGHEIYFALALADYATPEDLKCFETVLGIAGKLRSEELGDEQKTVREDLKRRDRNRTGLSKQGIRRIHRVRRVVEG